MQMLRVLCVAAVLASCLALVCSGEPAAATSKLDALRAMVEVDAAAACPGTCKERASCAAGSSILTGKCPGSASIICCVPASSTVRPSTPVAPRPVTPVAPPAASSKCAAVGGTCQASCSGFATAGLCAGTSICCAAYSSDPFVKIGQLASTATSTCVKHTFTSQHRQQPSIAGKAPKSFLRGIAYTYAKAVCQPTRADVTFVGRAIATGTDDVFSQYKAIFANKGLPMSVSGLAVVRHMYTLLIGLGMCESNGTPCIGRDMTSDFSTADGAEAGLFQTSFGARRFSQLLKDLFAKYQASQKGCFREQFYGSLTCSANNWKNWPLGETSVPGFQWQKLTKECPAFAVEYAAVLLRVHGGPKGEWMPLRRQYAEVRPECNSMLQQVEALVQANPSVCAQLLA